MAHTTFTWNQGDQVNAATVGTKGMNNLESQYNQILTDLAAGIATAIGTTGIGTVRAVEHREQ